MKTSKYLELREYLDTVPVIETHEHYTSNTERYSDCFPLLLGYVKSDLRIAAGLGGERVIEYLADPKIPFRKRWECFEGLYAKCRHTAYARGMERGLALCWGIKEISYSSLCELNERLEERDNDFFCRTMERFHIKIHVADIFESRFFAIMEGTDRDYTEISRFAFPLPAFHRLYQYESIRYVEELTGKVLPTLEDYAAAVEELIEKAHAWGAVCIKDQSAYFRPIDYGQPTFHQAESVYNRLVSHPGETVGFREGRDLDDWLFSRFLRKAGELDMPVQILTIPALRIASACMRIVWEAISGRLMRPCSSRPWSVTAMCGLICSTPTGRIWMKRFTWGRIRRTHGSTCAGPTALTRCMRLRF